ncbi:hypothetical protein SAMD00019534_028550 [Acytostelium subglobosum LB1]|uniref:hypothetical protein n=1 Tax=Acytostelium subglobosum LB1 TaxID=1410327 RepID=UPI000644FA89|nr:hypothetical protein SAMD00019534_028550 [Acytostelium subglobosum LB1]GAM19680.1 hypothetical protein SAMD00019534_028550 [Acytostelium subglobosum LB1]|eukprot:XP_012756442.1 hypothetical protein SAMD00019534_028550 [Acytostelium subglobosum LB1]
MSSIPPNNPITNSNLKRRNVWVGLGIVGFIALAFAYPIYFVQSKQKQKKNPDGTLIMGRNASIRGTFLNSGSRDIGSSKQPVSSNKDNNNSE